MTTAAALRTRRYQTADREACRAVFMSNVPRYFAAAELGEFESFLDGPDAEFFVVELSGEVVGCGGYAACDGVGRLCWGMVEKGMHRRAIGQSLLQFRLQHLLANADIDRIEIDTSQHSAGFFARAGFRVEHTCRDGFGQGIDRVAMSLHRHGWQPTDWLSIAANPGQQWGARQSDQSGPHQHSFLCAAGSTTPARG